MQAKFEMTIGRENLRSVLASFPPESVFWNEAQNRFQFVDRLLMECLGWEHPYVDVEVFDDAGGRADYLLGSPVRAALEAKKEAVRFDLLPTTKGNMVRTLRPLTDGCKALERAVVQVIPYCIMNGAQIAVVCNGPQMVIFQAHISGLSPLDGECFVFNGFDDYEKNFTLLWKLLSPEGVADNRAHRDLTYHRNPRIPEKASITFAEPNAYRYRSSFQENLRVLGTVLLDNVDNAPEVKSDFYRECYVPLEANNRHLLLSKNIIRSRYRRVSENGIAPARAAASVSNGKVKVGEAAYASPQGAKPVVVIGDVGVGKTSFFENLYETLTKDQRAVSYYVHINLGENATLSRDVKTFILAEIPRIFKEKYGFNISANATAEDIYKNALAEFDESPEGQLREFSEERYRLARVEFLVDKLKRSDEHLKAALDYLVRVKGRQVIVVIDNADQRDFATQQEAFLIAQELAAYRTVLVFVALRPSTFYQSKLTGALSGYQNQVLTISPPPADEVIRKRISFALRVAEGQIAPAALEGVELNLTNIVTFLKVTLRSIRASSKIRSFLSNITGGNTRLVIELMSSFCGSPNVESERIVTIERETGAYQVPLHEFTKHALLGEYAHFNALSSLVACNVFDVSAADPREHFLCSLIIAYISSPMGIKDNDGFVRGDLIIREMLRNGFRDEQTRHALERLAKKRLIETPHGQYREVGVGDNVLPDQFPFRATSIGLYHIRHWIGDFAFLDATCTDTPIFDVHARGTIFRLAETFNISERYERAVHFRAYLESRWTDSQFDINYYNLLPVFATHDSFKMVKRFLDGTPRPPNRRRRS